MSCWGLLYIDVIYRLINNVEEDVLGYHLICGGIFILSNLWFLYLVIFGCFNWFKYSIIENRRPRIEKNGDENINRGN